MEIKKCSEDLVNDKADDDPNIVVGSSIEMTVYTSNTTSGVEVWIKYLSQAVVLVF